MRSSQRATCATAFNDTISFRRASWRARCASVHICPSVKPPWSLRDQIRISHTGPLKQALRVCPGTSCGIAEPSQHEADRGKAEEGERLAVEVLPILGQSTGAVQPSYGAFDYRLYNVARRRLRGCLNWALAGRSVAECGTRSRHPRGQSRCVAQGREQSPVSQASQDRPALGRPSAQTLRDGRRPATARVVLRPLTERPEGAPGGEPRAP